MKDVLSVLNRFLAVRERAESEVREYLSRRRKFPPNRIESVLQFLRDEGFLNDARFARERFAYRLERGYGPLYIRRELGRFRIPTGTIEGLFSETAEGGFREEALRLMIGRLPSQLDYPDCSRRLRDYLRRRGYTGSQIEFSLQRLVELYPHAAERLQAISFSGFSDP